MVGSRVSNSDPKKVKKLGPQVASFGLEKIQILHQIRTTLRYTEVSN